LVCQAPRGPSTMYPRTVHQEEFLQPEPDLLKVNTTFPLPDLPNQPRDCYQIIGEGEVPLGDAMPTHLWPQIHWVERNRDSTKLTPRARVSIEILQSEAKFRVWGVMIKHKDARGNYPWSSRTKPNQTPQNPRNKPRTNPTKIARKRHENHTSYKRKIDATMNASIHSEVRFFTNGWKI
jgi:hypothetical protein